ncbi:serine/threonine transporter SstT [Candidatus Schmidhempelia bombi]|uniref:Serine/threonine transporter SstT n=1 Tax=Candidatus Schmidhempelia bombi str. Bimp TaxID=1387197 RepID=A0AB94IER0_9GAMM|nr:serine/threonine transporter SstT [Candidatus Schmidhempelia bombi]TEA27998.1 serine/threonine transporter SstT [Candidatus Schmidhempelia bombi str. Bimp]
MTTYKRFISVLSRIGLVPQIMIALLLGLLLAYSFPNIALSTEFLGKLFIKALQSVAPILVFILVVAAISNHRHGQTSHMRPIIALYFISTFGAALIAVIASFLFPSTLLLDTTQLEIEPPKSILAVITTIIFKMIDNPINALVEANYISLIVWGIGFGIALRHATDTTKKVVNDFSDSVTFIVRIVIRFAPLGILGLVASTIAETGFEQLWRYGHLIIVLISCMLIVLFVFNPLLAYWKMRANPFPLVWATIRESAVTAFFTRSSAANIPVNLALCKKLNLPESTYSISIPLGANVNLGGAAITITILTLATVHTLNIPIDLPTTILLCFVAAICACGASGVAGGSLLLIPVACSMFGIPDHISMSVVGIGFIISVIQDSVETAVNSSTDVVFTAAVCEGQARKEGYSILFTEKH